MGNVPMRTDGSIGIADIPELGNGAGGTGGAGGGAGASAPEFLGESDTVPLVVFVVQLMLNKRTPRRVTNDFNMRIDLERMNIGKNSQISPAIQKSDAGVAQG